MGPTLADLPPQPVFTSLEVTEPDEPRWIVEFPNHWNPDMVRRVADDIDHAVATGSSVLMLPDGAYLRSIRPEPITFPSTIPPEAPLPMRWFWLACVVVVGLLLLLAYVIATHP